MAILEVVAHLRANADDMVSGFRRAQNAANGFNGSVNQAAGGTSRAFLTMSRLATMGAVAIQGAATAGATMGVKFAMANEQAIISFKTLLGSQGAAEDMFKSLQQFAAKTPFEFPQLRDAASKLLTTGVAAERVIPMMTAIGDSTAAMGTGAEGIQRAVYALQQMNLVGKITGQDMMQLANAGIPAWDALASAAGMSVQQVKKAVERGDLQNSVQLLMSGIENYQGDAMSRVRGMMSEQSQTLVGLMSTLKDNINIALGDMMKPATKAIKDALPVINDAVGAAMKNMVGPVEETVKKLMAEFQKLIPAIGPTLIALSTVMMAFVTSFGSVMTAVASVLPQVQPAIEQLATAFSEIAAAVAPLVAQLAAGLVPIIADMAMAVASTLTFLARQKGLVAALIPVLGGLVAAYVAFRAVKSAFIFAQSVIEVGKMIAKTIALTTATTAQTVANTALATSETAVATATAGATAAQTGLNIAMYANPIGIVVAAIAALVVAFVMLWKKSESFRIFWKSVWNGIVEGVEMGVNAVLRYFQNMINGIIKGVNFLIRAWNAIQWGDDVGQVKELNMQVDLTAAKVSTARDRAKELSSNFKTAAEYATKLYEVNDKYEKAQQKADYRNKQRNKEVQAQANAEAEKKLKAAIQAARAVAKDALTAAQAALADMTQRADAFADSIKQAVLGAYSFTNALGKSLQTHKDYQIALDAVADAQEAVNRAISSRDYEGYVTASKQLSTAQDNLTKAEKGQMTFMQALEESYKQARDFNVLINRLRAAGLNQAGIDQVIAAGADTGSQIATELLNAGNDAIRQANTWFETLTTEANKTAAAARQTYYGEGLAAGQALVKGVEDAIAKLDLALATKGITAAAVGGFVSDFNKAVAALNRQYGVAVKPIEEGLTGGPVMSTPVGAITPELESLAKDIEDAIRNGFIDFGGINMGNIPMLAGGGVVKATAGGTLALIGEGGQDEAVIPLNRLGAMGSSNTYHITVHAGVGDKTAIAEQVVSALQQYEKRYGTVPVRTR